MQQIISTKKKKCARELKKKNFYLVKNRFIHTHMHTTVQSHTYMFIAITQILVI